jgi:enoyl-CoA hydratase/carnithine racemase
VIVQPHSEHAVEDLDGLVVRHDAAPGVAMISVDRPGQLNALRGSTLEAIGTAITRLEEDAEVSAVVLEGRGRAFCAGADIKEQAAFDADDSARIVALGQAVFARLQKSTLISVAALHGYVLGGGLELAMSCDVRVAATGARLGQPEVTLGHIPGWRGTQLLPALVGRSRALDLLLSGEPISATRALEIGLVDEVVEDGAHVAVATARAARYAAAPPHAARALKAAVDAGLMNGPEPGLEAERAGVALCWTQQDSAGRRDAFVARTEAHTGSGER